MTKREKMKIACVAANTTIARFAKTHRVSDVAVHHVLNGKTSKKLSKIVDRFIAVQFEKLRLSTGSRAA